MSAEWNKANPDKMRTATREWRQRNPEWVKDVNRRNVAKRRAWLAEIKLASGCVDCGYREHAEALEFDHLPGTEKLFCVAAKSTCGHEKLTAEIAKCEVVCANCHRVRTASRR